MYTPTATKGTRSAGRLLNTFNSWVTTAVVMTLVAIWPVFRLIESSRHSYRLRDENSLLADWVSAEALAWTFGATISAIIALFLWGRVLLQARQRATLASRAVACGCNTDDQDPSHHESECQYREFLCLKAHEIINR